MATDRGYAHYLELAEQLTEQVPARVRTGIKMRVAAALARAYNAGRHDVASGIRELLDGPSHEQVSAEISNRT